MRISARNNLKGKIEKIDHGSVNTEVTIVLPGGQKIVSIITKHSAEDLGLKTGKEVYALIKASNVLIGVDHDA
jgi:molybdopterin-binding protein